MMARAYRADLWEAIDIIACGYGDNSFEEFREWLIGQGQAIFEKALSDPDNLADLVSKEMAGTIYEYNMTSILREAYAAITRSDEPIPFLGYPEEFSLIGRHEDYDDDSGYEKFPRITAKFGKCAEREFPFSY